MGTGRWASFDSTPFRSGRSRVWSERPPLASATHLSSSEPIEGEGTGEWQCDFGRAVSLLFGNLTTCAAPCKVVLVVGRPTFLFAEAH